MTSVRTHIAHALIDATKGWADPLRREGEPGYHDEPLHLADAALNAVLDALHSAALRRAVLERITSLPAADPRDPRTHAERVAQAAVTAVYRHLTEGACTGP